MRRGRPRVRRVAAAIAARPSIRVEPAMLSAARHRCFVRQVIQHQQRHGSRAGRTRRRRRRSSRVVDGVHSRILVRTHRREARRGGGGCSSASERCTGRRIVIAAAGGAVRAVRGVAAAPGAAGGREGHSVRCVPSAKRAASKVQITERIAMRAACTCVTLAAARAHGAAHERAQLPQQRAAGGVRGAPRRPMQHVQRRICAARISIACIILATQQRRQARQRGAQRRGGTHVVRV
jgi:hypothetical protein